MKFLPLLFIFIFFYSYSQSRVYKNYTVEDGLPSSEVYYSFQDSKGYMWFATDAGVSRFNGYEFENFTTENGLTDNTIFRIVEDLKGRVWFAPFNGQFCYYYKGEIHEYKYNCDSKDLYWIRSIQDFYIDHSENIWVGTKEKGVIKIGKNGTSQKSKINVSTYIYNHFLKVDSLYVLGHVVSEKSYESYRREDFDVENTTSFSFVENIEGEVSTKPVIKKIRDVIKSKNVVVNVATQNGNMILHDFHNKLIIHEVNEDTILTNVYDMALGTFGELLFIKVIEDDIWISVRESGVYKCRILKGKLEVIEHYFYESSISSISKDKSKGYWFTSLNSGVYFLSNDDVKLYDFRNRSIFQLEIDTVKNILYTSFTNGKFYLRNLNNGQKKEVALEKELNKIKFDQKTNSLFSTGVGDETNVLMIKYSKDSWEVYHENLNYSTYFKDLIFEEDTLYLVNHKGIHILSDNFEYVSFADSSRKMWCTSIARYGKGFFIGTKKGLVFFEDKKIKKPFSIIPELSKDITCIEKIEDSIFLIGTKQYGVVILNKGKVERVINESKGLLNNLVRTIHCDNESGVWIGTSKGVSKIHNILEKEIEVFNLTKDKGLPSAEITDITSLKDTVYIGTARGLVSIGKNNLITNNQAPSVFIRSYKVNKTLKEKLSFLSYDENNLAIEYEALNYRSLGKVVYKYRLTGASTRTDWVETQSRLAQYTLLPPSDYLFEVKAENEDGVWSSPIRVQFTIYPPFWKTWWFISLIITGSVLCVFWITYLFFKRREKKIRIEKKLIELELKALRSQMNPHFIFNILNSIQHFMLQNNFKETNHYLTQFAKLIRTVLNLSEKNIITIGEEVEMLKLYMNLEKMRFENGFDYEIILGAEIDEDYDEIPSMLIQPYIENAIWHGLMNKKSKGKIVIKIDIIDDYLFCTVSDNGIGRDKAKEIKLNRKMKHKSVGMRITKDRLDLLNSETDVNVEIIDKVDDLNKSLGTEVNIKVKYVN